MSFTYFIFAAFIFDKKGFKFSERVGIHYFVRSAFERFGVKQSQLWSIFQILRKRIIIKSQVTKMFEFLDDIYKGRVLLKFIIL